MFCHKCGKEINENDKFCNSCGAIIGVTETKNYWKYLGYVWAVIINLITLGVVIAIYSSLYDSFEIISISILILIYLSIQTFAMTYGNATIENVFLMHAEFERLRKLLRKNDEMEEDEEFEKEEIKEARKKTNKAKVKMYINAGFAFIIYVIAIFNLLGAL